MFNICDLHSRSVKVYENKNIRAAIFSQTQGLKNLEFNLKKFANISKIRKLL